MRATYLLQLSSETKENRKNNKVSVGVLPRFIRKKYVEINDEYHIKIPGEINRKTLN